MSIFFKPWNCTEMFKFCPHLISKDEDGVPLRLCEKCSWWSKLFKENFCMRAQADAMAKYIADKKVEQINRYLE